MGEHGTDPRAPGGGISRTAKLYNNSSPIKIDTKFVLHAQHDGDELTDSCWMTATEVLSVGKQRGMKVPFPTLTNLKKLSEFGSINDAASITLTNSAGATFEGAIGAVGAGSYARPESGP